MSDDQELRSPDSVTPPGEVQVTCSPTDANVPVDIDAPPVFAARRNFTVFELLGLFAVSFSYAFVFNTINSIVIPKEIERLSSSRQSMWVGTIMAAGAISQLSTPIVGALSDRTGHRVPYMIYGTFVTILGIVLFLVVGTMNEIYLLFLAHVVTTVGLSVQYSMMTAMLHDHVGDEQVGRGSGAMAILAILGSGSGYAMFAMNVPLHYSYCCYILSTVICLGLTVMHTPTADIGREHTYVNAHLLSKPRKYNKCVDIAMHALSVPSPTRFPDFVFACGGRALFNTGLAGQVYLVYYLRDVVRVANAVQITSTIAVMALVGGVVGALPAGIISDRVGKKPVIYISIAACVASLALFMSTMDVVGLQFVGFVYGIGNVAYLSVDYALGVQALPKRHDGKRFVPIDAAKDLGVFAMSSTVGQLFGQVVYGFLLEQFGEITPTGLVYAHHGFILVYLLGGVCFIASGISTYFIRGVR
jgi:MFS family permease